MVPVPRRSSIASVHEQMQRLVTVDPGRQNRQAAASSAEGRVIRDGDIDAEHVGDRSQHALGLTQRLMKHQAKREARLDGDRRIDGLTAPLAGSGGVPASTASSVNHTIRLPRRINAASYSGQFVTR
jgi:hypothetical protein